MKIKIICNYCFGDVTENKLDDWGYPNCLHYCCKTCKIILSKGLFTKINDKNNPEFFSFS